MVKKDVKIKDIVYLKERIDELDSIYPKSVNSKSIVLLKSIENYEKKIDYKRLSYKISFSIEDNVRSYEINI